MTFTPEAEFDPAKLEAAVIEVDFTPTGVTIWLRGTASTDDLPTVAANETVAWLVNEGSAQRFLLVASDKQGKEALATLSTAPPGTVTVYGEATHADANAAVTVRVAGRVENE